MTNLLNETKKALEENGKKIKDVKWVGTERSHFTWKRFVKISDFNYDSGFGGQEVAKNLLIVGDGWWLERGEYDGSEWWEYKEYPKKEKTKKVHPSILAGSDSWVSLEELNNIN